MDAVVESAEEAEYEEPETRILRIAKDGLDDLHRVSAALTSIIALLETEP